MLQQQGSSMSETKSSQRFHSLNADQVEVLHQVLSEVVPIHGRGNFPTLELRPRDIIIAVRARLESQGITVRDVRLNGSTASHVLVRDNGTNYKDLDIIFGVELPSQEEFEVIKESVLGCLLNCLPAGVNRERISSATMKEAYVQKMVKVFNEHDRWSLISLSNNSGKNLELKFVSALRRQFEFSVDSFQIILDRLLESYMLQETQHKQTSADLKDQLSDQYAENQTDSSSRLKQANSTETNNSTDGDSPSMEETPTSQTLHRDMVQEKESQTEHLRQTRHPKLMTKLNSENKKIKQLLEHKETRQPEENFSESNVCDQTSLNLLTEEKQTSENTQPPTQTKLRQEPELLKTTTKGDNLQQTQPCDCQHPTHFKETSARNLQDEQKEPAEHTEQAKTQKKSNIAQTEHVNVAELGSSEGSNIFIEDMSRTEEDEALHVSTLDSSTSLHLKSETQLTDERNVETEMLGQKEGERDTERNGMTKEISASEGESVRETQGIDCSCSNSSMYFTPHNTCPTGIEATENIYNPLPTGNSDKKPKTLDALSPPDTQDILQTPPSLVSDKKTSSSPCKASDRLSNMVVLKHSSPKPPRRMCRKIIPSQFPSPSSDSEPGPEPCLNPEPEIDFKHKLPSCGSDPNTIPTTSVSEKIKLGPDPTLSGKFLDKIDPNSIPVPSLNLISHPPIDLRSTLPHELPVSQVITESSDQTNIQGLRDTDSACAVSHDQCQSSIGETVSLPKQSEPPDSVDALVLHTDTLDINTQEPLHTSEVELSEKDENRELQTKSLVLNQEEGNPQETTLASSSTSYCVTPPVLSLSPPCFSSPSLSPPQCHTPPSHCLPSQTMGTVSSAASFGTPSLSVSPTSSCHSSPPYLTPPMLSLSPPPLCLSPPSPCLSPPLLCLTPPVESEDFVSQVSSDKEPLILNTDSEELLIEASPQPGIPLLQLEDKKEPDYITSLPLVSELVSFPITISSSATQEVPHSQSRGPEESAPPPANTVSCPMTESTEVTEIASETPEPSNNPQASSLLPAVEVLAESMYGDFEAAMDHLRYRLIATRNPEEIRGGGLLKYSNLLVRDYRPASETQIKTLERYMCSRFFIDFPDVQEQQRKILSYLKNHFIGEERSKYQYLMTLRRVVDDSTVCLMGHERRQTLNMITVLALKVLGEQNIIPNTDHVTCFYQPAPYLAEHSAPYLVEPSYCSYYIPQGGSTLLYQPYPLHLQTQTGLV